MFHAPSAAHCAVAGMNCAEVLAVCTVAPAFHAAWSCGLDWHVWPFSLGGLYLALHTVATLQLHAAALRTDVSMIDHVVTIACKRTPTSPQQCACIRTPPIVLVLDDPRAGGYFTYSGSPPSLGGSGSALSAARSALTASHQPPCANCQRH